MGSESLYPVAASVKVSFPLLHLAKQPLCLPKLPLSDSDSSTTLQMETWFYAEQWLLVNGHPHSYLSLLSECYQV